MVKEFAGAMISGIDHLISKLNAADVMLAQRLLDATFYEYPRPAWDTGELRSSGAAYIGATKVAETPATGQNPATQNRHHLNTGKREGNQSYASLRMRGLRTATDVIGGLGSTVRGRISIVYRARAAALMHEWTASVGKGRKFSTPDAGPHYISAKLARSQTYMVEVFRRILA